MRFGLKEETVHAVCAVFSAHPEVQKAILYGSRAKGTHRNGSDIDITLLGGSDLTLDVLRGIMSEIDDLLLPYTFDLSIFQDISDTEVLEHIRRVGAVFYENPGISPAPGSSSC